MQICLQHLFVGCAAMIKFKTEMSAQHDLGFPGINLQKSYRSLRFPHALCYFNKTYMYVQRCVLIFYATIMLKNLYCLFFYIDCYEPLHIQPILGHSHASIPICILNTQIHNSTFCIFLPLPPALTLQTPLV